MIITAVYLDSQICFNSSSILTPDIKFDISYTPYLTHLEKGLYICNVNLKAKTAVILSKGTSNEYNHRHRETNARVERTSESGGLFVGVE